MTDKPRCETCRWWKATWRDDQWGECHCKLISGYRNKYVGVGDYERLLTSETFGCIFHEERDE